VFWPLERMDDEYFKLSDGKYLLRAIPKPQSKANTNSDKPHP